MSLGRYIHTVRYLKPIQIYGRVRLTLGQPKPDLSPPPPLRAVLGNWHLPARREPSLIGASRFRFLNKEYELSAPDGWNDPSLEKLWLYNLHYFDDLNAHQASNRRNHHVELIKRWIKENPAPDGIGWEPYPLSLRVVNWIKWALSGNQLPDSALASMAVQVRYLFRRLEWHLLGNHLFANAKALVFAGLFFHGPEADKWLTRGLSLLEREIPEQILDDGGHFERSPMYHSIVLEDLLDLYNLAHAYAHILAAHQSGILMTWTNTIKKMRGWLKVMSHPDGEIALFNDAAFGIAPSPTELETYAHSLGLGPVKVPVEGVTHLASSGYVRLQKEDAVAILDVGEIGPAYLPGHAHADTLTFELSLFGSRVIVNSGISSYQNCEVRQRQRSTGAHNTIVVDGMNSSEVWGGFRVARRANPQDLEIADHGSEGLRVACSHDGFQRLPGRVLHRRSWLLTGRELEVTDLLDGNFTVAVASFHLHPSVEPVRAIPGPAEMADFQVGEHSISWSCQGATGLLQEGIYYPQFGISRNNFCLSIQMSSNRACHRFGWQ